MLGLFVLGLGIFFFSITPAKAQVTNYQSNPNLCPTEDDSIQQGVSCSGGQKICGATANQIFCYDNSTLATSGSSISSTSYGSSFDTHGGYVIECYSHDGTSPLCDNSGSFWCNSKASCTSNNRITVCNDGFWNSDGAAAASCSTGTLGTDTGCVSGNYNCFDDDGQGDNGSCEASNGSDYRSSSSTNATYGASCSATSCKTGYIDCDDANNDPDNDDATGQTDTDGCGDALTNTGYSNSELITSGTGFGTGGFCGAECASGYLSCDSSGNATSVNSSDYDAAGCNIQASTTAINPSAFSQSTYLGIADAVWDTGNVLHGSTCGDTVCSGSYLDCDGATLGTDNDGNAGTLDTGKGSDGSCEQTANADASGSHGQNTVYATSSGSCRVQCASGYYNPDGSIANGCEVQDGGSCDPGTGGSGTYSCDANSCTCVEATPLNFQTGVEAAFQTANALLQGVQQGAGDLISFTNSAISTAIFKVTNSGWLGIGNSTPSSVLHTDSNADNSTAILTLENTAGDSQFFRVDATPEGSITGSVGDIAIDGTNGTVYVKSSGDATNTGWTELTSGSSGSYLSSNASDSYTSGTLTFNDSTILGIGTGNDLQLTHNGTNTVLTSATGNLVIDNTNTTGSTQIQLGTDTDATALQILNNTGTNLFEVDGSGNVGIGDTSPAALLTVGNGDLFQVNSSGAIAAATGITSSGTITLSGLSTDGVVTVSSGVLGSTANSALDTGTLDSLDSLQFIRSDTSDAFTSGTLTFNDSTILGIGTGNDLQLTHNGTNTVLTSATGNLLFDNTNVTGNTQLQLGTDTNATAFQVLNNTGTTLFEVDGGGVVSMSNLDLSGNTLSTTSGNLNLDSASGAVVLATGDALQTTISGNPGTPADGMIWYDSVAQKYKIRENGVTKVLCNATDQSCGAGTGSSWSALSVPAGNLSLAMDQDTTTFDWTSTGDLSAWNFSVANNSTTITNQKLLTLTNSAVGTFADSNTEALLVLDQADTTVVGTTALDNGILITNTGGSTFTDAIDVSDAGIENAINIGANVIAGTNFSVTGAGVITTTGITSSAGNLVIDNTNTTGSTQIQLGTDTDATALQILNNTGTNLFEVDGSGTGTIAGNLLPSTDNVYSLGSASQRWKDLWVGPGTIHIGETTNHGKVSYNTTQDHLAFDPDGDLTHEIVFTDEGHVGIGDITPVAALTVGNGDLFQVNSSGAVAAATGITSSGTITFSGLTTDGIVTSASGTLGSTATIGAGYITADSLNFSEFSDSLVVDATTTFDLDANSADLNFDSNTLYIDSSENRVGIGTTAPNSDLQIGSSWGAHAITFGDTNWQIGTATSGSLYNMEFSTYDSANRGFKFTNNNDDDLVYIEGDTGYMGLGTTDPSNFFHIYGRSGNVAQSIQSINDNAIINIIADSDNVASDVNQDALLYFYSGQTGSADAEVRYDGSLDALKLNAQSNDGSQLVLSSNGNVGIGDTTPAAALTVGSGDLFQVDSSGNVTLNADSTALTLGAGSDFNITHNGTNTVATSATGNLIIDNTNTTGATQIQLGTDTNVTNFQVLNNTGTALFEVDGAGNTTLTSGSLYQSVYGSDTDLVLYLPYTEAGTDQTQYDRSPYGNDGVGSGGVVTSSSNGKYGSGSSFDGTDDVITLPSTTLTSILSTADMTAQAWVYPTAYASSDSWHLIDMFLFGRRSGQDLVFGVGAGGSLHGGWWENGFAASADGTLPLNTWTHVAMTYSDSDNVTKLYANGVEVASVSETRTIDHSYQGLTIGDGNNGQGEAFAGRIAESKIYKRALSQDEIRAQYLRGADRSSVAKSDSFKVIDTNNDVNLIVNNNGQVGIGTTAPSTALQVGEVSGEKDVTVHGDIFIGKVDNDDQFNISNIGNADTSLRYLQIVDNDSIGTFSGLNVTRTGVGIGTTSPSSLLQVSAGTDGDAVLTLEADSDNSNESDNPSILFKQDGGLASGFIGLEGLSGTRSADTIANSVIMGTEDNAHLQLITNDAARLTVLSSGNVGIGVTNPSYTLDVNGNFRAGSLGIDTKTIADTGNTSSIILDDDQTEASNMLSLTATSHLNLMFDSNNNSSGAFRILDGSSDTDTANEFFRITSSGNVGIGDSSPQELFTVGDGDLFQINSSGAIAAATGITSSGTITLSGLTTDGVVTATGGVLGTTALNSIDAGTLDSLDSTQFLRSDASDSFASGTLSFEDSTILGIGTGNDLQITHNGTNSTITSATGNLIIDNTDVSSYTKIQLGSDTAASIFEVVTDTNKLLFGANGAGNTFVETGTTDNTTSFQIWDDNGDTLFEVFGDGNVAIYGDNKTSNFNPTAALHLGAGKADNPALKFTDGTLTSTLEDGSLEYEANTGGLYFTGGGYREKLNDRMSSSMASSAVSTWTSRTAPAAEEWQDVTWSPELGMFAAVSSGGSVMTSSDGITWTAQTAAETNNWKSIEWSPKLGLFAAVSSNGTNRVMTSPDGVTWTARSAAATKLWIDLTWSPELELFVAVAQDSTNNVMTSSDGITWTSHAGKSGQWDSVTWSPEQGIFVAVGVFNTLVMTSPDGATWTTRTAAQANTWRAVAWSPELGLFAAVSDGGTDRVMTSPDGITWTSRSASENAGWHAITWAPELGLFIAAADNGTDRVMTSPDGVIWTGHSVELSGWFDIAWSPELGVAVGVAISGTNRITTSKVPNSYSRSQELLTGRMGIGTTSPTATLHIEEKSNKTGLQLDSSATTADTFSISGDSLTTGSLASFATNSSDTSTRNVVEIVNDHASATGATALYLRNDSTGLALDADGDVDITGDITIMGDLQHTGELYDLKKTWSFPPGSVSTLYTQYIGTYHVNGGPVIIELRDGGVNHGSSSRFEVVKHYGTSNVTFVTALDGSRFSDYTIYYRNIDAENYELFWGTSNTDSVNTVSYEAWVTYQGTVTDSLSASNDTDINASTIAMVVNRDGWVGMGAVTPDATLDIVSTNTLNDVLQITADSLETGSMASFYSNSSGTSFRNLVEITNDNDAADNATALYIKQDGNADAINISAGGVSTADVIDIVANDITTGDVISLESDSSTTGSMININSSSGDTSSRYLVDINNYSSVATGAVGLRINQASTADAMYVQAAGSALDVDATATTADIIDVAGNSLTTGSLATFSSSSSDASIRNLVEIINDDAAATGATALYVQNDSTGDILNLFDGTTEVFTVIDGGNVGIGTTSPSSLLEVSAGTDGDAVLTLSADTDNSNDADNPSILFQQDGGTLTGFIGLEGIAGTRSTDTLANAVMLGSENSTPVQLITNDTARLTVTHAGDVGIGTNTPSADLEIVGQSTTDALVWDNGAGALRHSYDALTWGRQTFNMFLDTEDDNTNASFQLFNNVSGSSGNTPTVSLNLDGNDSWINSGDFGFGTITPNAKLDVVDTSTDTTAATTEGLEFTVSDTGVVTTGTDSLTGLDFDITRTGATGGTINTIGLDLDVTGDTGGTSTLTGLDVNVSGADTNYAAIFQGGNVGVGTTAPAYDLDVAGNVRVANTLIVDGALMMTGGLSLVDGSTQLYGSTPSDRDWHLSMAAFKQSESTSTENTGQMGLFFKPDGLTMYTSGSTLAEINQYTLSTAWDVSSASATSVKDVSAENSNPSGVSFKPDGSKMYVAGQSGDEINEYTLSTPWDVTTASPSQVADFSTQVSFLSDVSFREDGTKMYLSDESGGGTNIEEYTLSTAWDISTASHVQGTDAAAVTGVAFKRDGRKMYVVENTNDQIVEYQLTTPWDVSTAVATGTVLSVNTTRPESIYINPDGTKLYLLEQDDIVYEYDLGMVIEGGNVGIGTTSPSGKLNVYQSADGAALDLDGAGVNSANILDIEGSALTSGGSLARLYSNSSSGATRNLVEIINDNTSAFNTTALYIQQDGAGENAVGLHVESSSGEAAMFMGEVGVNDPSPDHIFTVDHNGDGTNIAYVNSSNAWTSGSADYAEYYYTVDTDLASGEAVCIDTTRENAVKRCARAADINLMGIISTSPAFLGNAPSEERRDKDPNYVIVGMLGQVPAMVSNENGAIRLGDSLTSATEPGYIMKADAGDPTVGVALEELDETTGTINVLISRKNKSLTIETVEQEVAERIAGMQIEDDVQLMVTEAVDTLNLDENILSIVDRELAQLDIETTVAEQVMMNLRELGIVATGTDALTGLGFKEIDDKVEGQSLMLAELGDSLRLESEGTGDETSEVLVALGSDFDQLEKRVTDLEEEAASRNQSGEEVLESEDKPGTEKEPTTQLAEKVAAEELENILTEEELLEYAELSETEKASYRIWRIVDRIVFSAKVRFENVVEFASSVVFQGKITVNTDTAGTITIPAGSTKAIATFNTPFEKAPIISLTPTQSTFESYFLEEVTEEGFAVSTPLVLEYDLVFNWTAVVVEGEPIKVEHFNEEELLKEKLEELSNGEVQESFESEVESEINLEEVISINQEQTENSNKTLIVVSPGTGFVRLRSESNIASQELDQIPNNTQLKYFEKENGWYQVEYEGKTGWISEDYIEIIGD